MNTNETITAAATGLGALVGLAAYLWGGATTGSLVMGFIAATASIAIGLCIQIYRYAIQLGEQDAKPAGLRASLAILSIVTVCATLATQVLVNEHRGFFVHQYGPFGKLMGPPPAPPRAGGDYSDVGVPVKMNQALHDQYWANFEYDNSAEGQKLEEIAREIGEIRSGDPRLDAQSKIKQFIADRRRPSVYADRAVRHMLQRA